MPETVFPVSSLGGGMNYTKLGSSSMDVSSICVGCMAFGDLARWPRPWLLNPEESAEIVKHALDLGVNWFDTANMYALGSSEEYLGAALKKLKPNRDELVIETKVNQRMASGPNRAGSSRKEIMNEIDVSLKRLQLDYVDVLNEFSFKSTFIYFCPRLRRGQKYIFINAALIKKQYVVKLKGMSKQPFQWKVNS